MEQTYEYKMTSQGRLGGRVGLHFDPSQGRAIEPYAKAEVIEELLTGNTVRANTTNFNSSLSGTAGRFGGGVTAKISQSIYRASAKHTNDSRAHSTIARRDLP
jgi:outer membrane autotransporter protein